MAFAVDIMNRRVMHERIYESERGYRMLIEALGVAVYTTDAQGYITLFNEAAVELWGRKPEIGKDLWCGSWKIFHPDGRPMALEECPMGVALRASGRPYRNDASACSIAGSANSCRDSKSRSAKILSAHWRRIALSVPGLLL